MPKRTPMLLTLMSLLSSVATGRADEYRVEAGLHVLYDFRTKEGDIPDRSGHGINLHVTDPTAVRREDGSITILKPTILRAAPASKRLIDAIRQSGEVTVETWVRPADVKQNGPARLVTISKDSVNRNFTLGQDATKYDARLRTTKTSANGIPSITSQNASATASLTHVLYVHSKEGHSGLYVNGKRVADRNVGDDLSGWDPSFALAIGNELTMDRPWLGTIHMVAIYRRALSISEITQNFTAGPEGRPSPELIAERKRKADAHFFETSVAPLLAKHCLECHDSATHANGLDLSRKAAAFKGGANGKSIIPGRAADSELWASVEAETMPLERPPLTTVEKDVIKKWINDGAAWTLPEIDPAIYVHGATNQNFVQRLTTDEYIETVRATVGVDIEQDARKLLPRDLRADGFSNTSYNLNVGLKHVDSYARLAELIVSRMNVKDFVAKFSNRRKFTDKDMGDVISKVGYWVLRGPLDEREVIAFRGITTTVASAGGHFDEAMGLVLEAMLQSPRFVYRIESQRGEGSMVAANQYELASRLSYILWGGPPDEALLKAADNRELHLLEIGQHADRMLKDPRAVQQSLRFLTDWLNLNRLDNLRPNARKFPAWNARLASDMRSETRAYFEEVVWNQNRPLAALLNSQLTFASPQLAQFYGLTSQHVARNTKTEPTIKLTAARTEEQRYDLTDVPGRGGILTQGSLLTVGGDNASMVTRGLLVMHELLRGVVKDPPPCVDTTPVPTKRGLTQRAIAMSRIANANCGGCHSRFEPLAFGLEKFDGIGAYHEQDEHGNRLRDDGEILIPGQAGPVRYASAAELMDLLANSDRVNQSLTWKITQFALGRPLVAEDAAMVDKIHQQAQADGGTWPAVMKAVVTSHLVLKTRTEPDKAEAKVE